MKPSGLADSPLFQNKDQLKEKENIESIKKIERPQAIMTPRYHDSMTAIITKSVREVGKEVCTYRLTQKEKTALVEIIYHFRMRNSRLSENEIARIAINFLIEDFKANKNTCMLSSIVEAMKA
jgi:hypothetical protein